MDPAHDTSGMDTTNPEPPTAMQRLESAEGEMHRMAGDISSLIQLGHQQQRLFQQQQQEIREQRQRLDQVLQLLINRTPLSGPAPASAHAPATSPSVPPLLSVSAPPLHPPAPDANAPAPGPPRPDPDTPEPRIGNPERFNGDPTQARAFVTSCRLQFSLQPRTFATEGAKVAYAITHLTGRARLWGTAEFERQTPACSTFDLFAKEILKVFDFESTTAEASQTLLDIRQGRRTVADYAIDFRTRAMRSSWNMEGLVNIFYHSLADYIKDELVSHDRPSTLDEAIALAICIDRRIQTRRREKGRLPTTSPKNSPAAIPPVSAASSQLGQSEPMEIGRASLTPAERQRRLTSNLCLYCGGEGHRVATCPVKAGAHQM